MSSQDSGLGDRQILITGATGFVGGHIAQRLHADGATLRLLVRPTSRTSRLPRSIRHSLDEADGTVELFEGDVTQPNSLEGIFEGVDGLIHCACAVKGTFDESQESQQVFERVNVDGTGNLANLAAEAGLRMVHLSSTAAMGPVTVSEVDETTPCVPSAPYQISKRQAELALLELHDTRELDVVILRPCLILGPGKDAGEPLELFNLVRRGLFPKIGGRMHQRKPLVDVRDVVRAARLALSKGESGQIYLIHSDGDHRLDDILEVTRRLVGASRSGVPLPVLPMRVAAYACQMLAAAVPTFNPPLTPGRLDLFLADRHISIAKARRELGFNPQVQDLYDMLGSTYLGYIRSGQLHA